MDKLYGQTIKPDFYPKNLQEIKYSPKELYYLGNKELFQEKNFLAVVGSRKASVYGKKVLRFILPEVAKTKIVIVSGLALGIDSLAHRIALENKCPTIAVMAGGLDQIYPPEHRKIAEEIIEAGGMLISEHPPGTQYLKQYFPARNRIISGLSDAVLIVEAKEKSGALITASFAFSQERKVLATPGDVFSKQSQGVNGLFSKGAKPIQNSNDIFKALFGRKKNNFSRSNISTNKPESPEEGKILSLMSRNSAVSLNFLIQNSKLPTAKVIALVTQMELKGMVEQVDGGYIQAF